jgi:hypothetical protein
MKQAEIVYKPGDYVRSCSSTGVRVCYILERSGGNFWALQLLPKTCAVVQAALRAEDILGFADAQEAELLTDRDALQRLSTPIPSATSS